MSVTSCYVLWRLDTRCCVELWLAIVLIDCSMFHIDVSRRWTWHAWLRADSVSQLITHSLLLLLHLFNGLLSRTIWLSRHRKGKPFWILLEQEMMGWQWHQLDHMEIICISLQTDNHASTSESFYRSDDLPAAQPTASKHWRISVDHSVKMLSICTRARSQSLSPFVDGRVNNLLLQTSTTRCFSSSTLFIHHSCTLAA